MLKASDSWNSNFPLPGNKACFVPLFCFVFLHLIACPRMMKMIVTQMEVII